jgi:dipeptidyl aminopeptidase/acylaminoacyl peptidase
MDSFKEHLVAMYGDRYLERGIARLTFDGPGQGESLTLGLWVTVDNMAAAGRAAVDWARGHEGIDAGRIGLAGVSFGSFWATQIAAATDALAGCATVMAMHEPGMGTLFDEASPTFKARFMYLSGFDGEAAFDAFAPTLTLDDVAPQVTCPYLAVVGEQDDLSPIAHTWRLLERISGPTELVLYQGEKHGIAAGPAAALGPNRDDVVVEWFADRFAGVPASERLRYVDQTGRVSEQPLGFDER